MLIKKVTFDYGIRNMYDCPRNELISITYFLGIPIKKEVTEPREPEIQTK